ncbi:hypothetical protein [Reinekea sp. G2M2-21]|uniref:hypothetical protein n=1 Tax=Reinekea sp. G2M2-21 TaxID=2788942 RepID=UPI0018A95F09|nr:hypothetical protein [Reinekea sp. G2M2-21]
MAPKGIGLACYFLILTSVILFAVTLIASQHINLLHLSADNEFSFETQVGLSLLNSFITLAAAISILKGYVTGRTIWHGWAVLYFFLNAWQLENRIYLIPAALTLLLLIFLLYAGPSQKFFREQQQMRKRAVSRRIDNTYNIFDDRR